MREVIRYRFDEIAKCLYIKAPSACTFLIGSVLEGLLHSIAIHYPDIYNHAVASPKERDVKTKVFPKWTLSDLLKVSKEVGVFNKDMNNFNNSFRKYRNYIHPYEQLKSDFHPDFGTAIVCYTVLKETINQIYDYVIKQINNNIKWKY